MILTREQLEQAYDLLSKADLLSRSTFEVLVGHFPREFVDDLDLSGARANYGRRVLKKLNTIQRLTDFDGVPIQEFLKVAAKRAEPRSESAALRLLAEAAGQSASPLPTRRPDLTSSMYTSLQRQARQAIAHLTDLADGLGQRSVKARGDEALKGLAQNLYRVAIVGRSRAGKSTLVNSLVDQVVCPTSRRRTTAIPIIICPGDKKVAHVFFNNDQETVQIDSPFDAGDLELYASQSKNPGNQRSVDRIEVELTDHVLDLGVAYIDIPGFDDPNGKVWKPAKQEIKNAHAIVLVLDTSPVATGGFTVDRETIKVLQEAAERQAKVFIVGNKADRLEQEDVQECLEIMTSELKLEGLKPPEPLYLTDARGSSARAATQLTPIPAFRDALWNYLWRSDSVGLRRLLRVFHQLRLATEEFDSLFALRSSRAPERQRVRNALSKARKAFQANLVHWEAAIGKLERIADDLMDVAYAEVMGGLDDVYQDFCQRETRRVSHLRNQVTEILTAEIEAVQQELTLRASQVASDTWQRTQKCLQELRRVAGSSAVQPEKRSDLQALFLYQEVDTPFLDRVLGAGLAGGAGAALGFWLGGPVGALIGGSLTLMFADWATDFADNPERALVRVQKHADHKFSQAQTIISSQLQALERDVRKRLTVEAEPYFADVENLLEDLRPPTAEELELHQLAVTMVDSAITELTKAFSL